MTEITPELERQWTSAGELPEANGRSTIDIICPFCNWSSRAYLWSLAGCGKRCENPKCNAKHDRWGISRITGQPGGPGDG